MQRAHQTNMGRTEDRFYKNLLDHIDMTWGRVHKLMAHPGGRPWGGSTFVSSTSDLSFATQYATGISGKNTGVLIKINPSKISAVNVLKIPPKYPIAEGMEQEAEWSISGGIPGSTIDEITIFLNDGKVIQEIKRLGDNLFQVITSQDGNSWTRIVSH